MSEYDDLDSLTDEDYEAIGRIVEGVERRLLGAHILDMWQEGQERQEQENRSLLDSISRARLAQAESADPEEGSTE